MKFATKVVIFLSSSFASVKGDDVCLGGSCYDPATTTYLSFEYGEFSGTIPTAIGLLPSVTYIYIGTCFGGCSNFFGSSVNMPYHSRLVELCVSTIRQLTIPS